MTDHNHIVGHELFRSKCEARGLFPDSRASRFFLLGRSAEPAAATNSRGKKHWSRPRHLLGRYEWVAICNEASQAGADKGLPAAKRRLAVFLFSKSPAVVAREQRLPSLIRKTTFGLSGSTGRAG